MAIFNCYVSSPEGNPYSVPMHCAYLNLGLDAWPALDQLQSCHLGITQRTWVHWEMGQKMQVFKNIMILSRIRIATRKKNSRSDRSTRKSHGWFFFPCLFGIIGYDWHFESIWEVCWCIPLWKDHILLLPMAWEKSPPSPPSFRRPCMEPMAGSFSQRPRGPNAGRCCGRIYGR